MEDKQSKVLEFYDFKVKNSYRTRGAQVLETSDGVMLLREHRYIGAHFLLENQVKDALFHAGMKLVDQVVPSAQGNPSVQLESGEQYVITRWFHGDECNLRERRCIIEAAENLGRMHGVLKDFPVGEDFRQKKVEDSFVRHTREMKRVCRYMKDKKQKNEFEIFALDCFDGFYEQSLEAQEMLQGLRVEENGICHGDYNYHNVIFTNKGVATTNFDKVCRGEPLQDLYYFLRKTMEKNNWESWAGEAVLEGYERQQELSQNGNNLLYVMLRYPEKYWKLLNQYYNRKKSWLSKRNIEKLMGLSEQSKEKEVFLQELKRRG